MNIKTFYRLMLLLVLCVGIGSCKKDDPAPVTLSSQIQGSWAIATSEGTEWEEGVGIVTPRAPDPGAVGLKLVIDGTNLTVKDITGTVLFGPMAFTLNETDKTILIGENANTGLGMFTISDLVAGASMNWDQREPVAADYEPQAGCGCNLYFQKFWGLAKTI